MGCIRDILDTHAISRCRIGIDSGVMASSRTQEKHQYLIGDIVGGAMLNPNQTAVAMVRRTASVDGLRSVPSAIQI